jgi:hypothetical protein
MNRRTFLETCAIVGVPFAGALPLFAAGGSKLHWQRDAKTRLFTGVSADGAPLVAPGGAGLLAASCRIAGEAAGASPLRVTVMHRLRDSGAAQGEDVLEATLTVRNTSGRPQQVEIEFATAARPSPRVEEQRVYVPLSAAGLFGDGRFTALGVKQFLKDCDHLVGTNDFAAHYLEPMASFPAERETRALLLAPVVDVFDSQRPWHVALFTPSDQPMRFGNRAGAWRAGRQVAVAAGGAFTQRCWLMVHQGNASVAWKAFHRFGHREDFAVPGWAREFKVHYYDFLSSADGEKGRRGNGYESDLPHFREFRVGLATQHGCYATIGDFIQPDRKTWQAMRGDKQGAAEMSFEKMRARIKATRAAGAKAAVYMHPACFDDAAPYFSKLRDAVLVDAKGQPTAYGWTGPDTVGKNWRTSLGSAQWREHLLQQAQWIMDILRPDAIVMDETFAGLTYDHHPDRSGPTSAGAIDFYRKLRALVRSFGSDKAFFTSDCSMSPFVLWADGECGDHAYPGLLGHGLYTQEPVRYLAALGDKPWRPCAWHFQSMWNTQMKLARQVGAGVGVSNGWLEYTGLTRLPAEVKAKMLADITTICKPRN